jgi:myo-inositol-1(or 4)-monophosphatase
MMDSMNYDFSPEVEVAVDAAIEAAELLSRKRWSTDVTLKEHPTFGTSSVTEADKGSQALIFRKIRREFPDALVIGEESENPSTPSNLERADLAYFVDPLDGTTEYAHELPNWSVSIGGKMLNKFFGVIAAPDVRGGFLMATDGDGGVFLWERGNFEPVRIPTTIPPPAKPVICLGLDVQRLDTYQHFLSALPKALRPRGLAPSGALGLALTAAGRYDAIIQSPQMPWDWLGGYPMIGGDTIFLPYFIEEGEIVPVVEVSRAVKAYRNDEQTLGFVAGREEIAHELFKRLMETYGKK